VTLTIRDLNLSVRTTNALMNHLYDKGTYGRGGGPLQEVPAERIQMSTQYTKDHHVEELRCAACEGDGWAYAYDGVGGRWEERCHVCHHTGLVKVLVPNAAPPEPLLTLAEMESRHVQHVLAAHNGNKTRTAKTLGIDRRSVYRRLQAPSRRFRSKQSERTAR